MTVAAPTAMGPKAWAAAIATPAQAFDRTALSVIEGQVPPQLRGTLYRNGPARFERQGQRVGHWFDGDGAVLAIAIADGQAWGTYQYVRSAGYCDEESADQYLYSGYGTLAPGSVWQRWSAQLKNAANTSVMVLPDRVLALWEGGWPYQLDPKTLETQGADNLGDLGANETYSAHPKRHPTTGHWFNFGIVAGANATLNLYRSHPSGTLEKKHSIPLNGIPLIHDFVLTNRYLVFCVPPVRLNALPAVLGLRSFSDALMWQPKRGTQIIVVDAESFEVVACEEVEPWFQWHFGHGYLTADGDVVLHVVRYVDFQTNQQLKEVASGQIQTHAPSQFWQLRLNPDRGTVEEQQCLVAEHCEFPVIQGDVSLPIAPSYLSIHRDRADTTGELFGAIARFDPVRGELTQADAGAHRYPCEPIYAPNPEQPGTGWVLTVVYDGTHHGSELWIYASDRLADGPICRLALPQVVPPSFHGAWQPAR